MHAKSLKCHLLMLGPLGIGLAQSLVRTTRIPGEGLQMNSRKITIGLLSLLGLALNGSEASADAHLKPLVNRTIIDESNRAASAHLAYYGGSMIANVKIVSVMWGAAVDPQTVANIGGFYSTVTNSSYMDFLSEYNTNIHAVDGRSGTGQSIGRGSLLAQVQIAPRLSGAKIDDSQIRVEIMNQIAARRLPAPEANTLYMIHFPKGITITQRSSGKVATSCKEFCAYHNSFIGRAGQVNYGVMPDMKNPGCNMGCGKADPFSNLTVTASHEMMEAITDSGVGLATGNSPNFPMGWYDEAKGEIGDICAQTSGIITGSNGKSYRVQGEWSNARNACVMGS